MFSPRGRIVTLILGLATPILRADDRLPLAPRMAQAAQKFLASLSPELQAKARFSFDDPERFRFAFVPLEDAHHRPTRRGVPLSDLSETQKQAALDLVRLGVSDSGAKQVEMVFELEAMLDQYEKPKRFTRNPGWYFVSIFGQPTDHGPWGWRIDGHHLSLNYTLDQGRIVAATPAFFGANPAEIQVGPKKGYRTLADAEDPALELWQSLDETQRQKAHQAKHFPEPTQFVPAEKVGAPVGLRASEMTPRQRAILEMLIRQYLRRLAPSVAASEWQAIESAGIENVSFALSGGVAKGQTRTYRVQGPTFVIQFLNTQQDVHGNPANHIHSIYRRLPADFGVNR